MKLTNRQKKELEVIKYFIPTGASSVDITDEDIKRFFDYSDKGVEKGRVLRESMQARTGLSALMWGKNRRDLQVASYKEDWGETLTSTDFTDEPKYIAEYVSKAMGKPGIMDMWTLANEPENLTEESQERLNPMVKLAVAPYPKGEK